MLNLNFEFRKGIFFVRLIGDLNKTSYSNIDKELIQLISENKFKYIVINTNYLNRIDLDGLNYMLKICHIVNENKGNLIICDKFKIIKKLLNNNILNIENEIEIL